MAALALGPGAVLVTYRSVRRSPGEAEERHVLRSAIWKEIGGSWQMLFYFIKNRRSLLKRS